MEAIADRPNFEVLRGTRATGLIKDDAGKVVGITARHGTDDEFEIRAKVVAGCDGVRSLVRREAGIGADIEWLEEYPMITAYRHPDQKADENWEIWSPIDRAVAAVSKSRNTRYATARRC
jgi:2-polyprenyl-6-methoxyphenol hydroxylase-like FAD-dependent oxidoreductase